MTTTTRHRTAITIAAPRRSLWRRWPDWIGYLAACWALGYGALGAYWASGGAGFPWGMSDPGNVLTMLRPGPTGWAIAIAGVGGAVLALTMARTRQARPARAAGPVAGVLSGSGVLLAAVLGLGLVDDRLLIALGYAVPSLVGAPFGWPPVNYFEVALPWPVLNQLVCLSGAALFAGTVLAFRRRARGHCGHCGRGVGDHGPKPGAARRWGRPAVAVAVFVPCVYAAERISWALGIPFGTSQRMVDELHASTMWLAGLGLAVMALAGGVLTLGLIQRWGAVFPRWMPGLAGRRVPPALAVVPGALVSVALLSTGPRLAIGLAGGLTFGGETPGEWGEWLGAITMLLLPVWGVALAVGTAAYYFRRREQCRRCGRD